LNGGPRELGLSPSIDRETHNKGGEKEIACGHRKAPGSSRKKLLKKGPAAPNLGSHDLTTSRRGGGSPGKKSYLRSSLTRGKGLPLPQKKKKPPAKGEHSIQSEGSACAPREEIDDREQEERGGFQEGKRSFREEGKSDPSALLGKEEVRDCSRRKCD